MGAPRDSDRNDEPTARQLPPDQAAAAVMVA
jgi:hypothetical protein